MSEPFDSSSVAGPIDLDTCAREPIHTPGAVQPHGVLFACRGPELVVQQVSENVAAHFGVPPSAVLGAALGALFDDATRARLAAASVKEPLREVNPLRAVTRSGAVFEAVLGRTGENDEVLLVELEPSNAGPDSASSATFDPRLRGSVLRLQTASDVARLASIAAEEVRTITGFDRVMIYRFDEEWNGEVTAESKREDLEPFLGLHYPASDIPVQARRLYTVNWLRFIGSVAYVPSPLVPANDPERGTPLDLSHSVLRSVSPIHIEYLKNMGVTASMSISLVSNGVLSGLIACHHYSGPRLVSYAVRETSEFLGQALSWHLRVLETAGDADRARRAQEKEAEVVRALASTGELIDALGTPALVAVTEAAGAAVVLHEATRRVGTTPSLERIGTIVRFLRASEHEVFSTERLAEHLPEAEDWEDDAAGLVAVAISRELGEYLLWFRPSTERTVNWGGDPRKVVVQPVEGGPPRLSPRGSFALWRETVRGRSLPWKKWQIDAASSLRRVLLSGVRRRSAELRAMNDRLTEADRAKDNFITTVSHELRTPLNAISGWTHLLQAGMKAERIPHALEVIARNVRAQSQLVEDLLDVSRITSGKLSLEVASVDLVALVESALAGISLAVDAKDITMKSVLDTTASQVLGDAARLHQVVANLLTNAVKFTPKGGTITVTLCRVESDVELSVSDTGQGIEPEFLSLVFEPFRQQDEGMNRRSQGLGLGLAIVRKLIELHGGQVSASSPGAGRGSTFVVRLPTAPFRASAASALEITPVVRPLESPPELRGLRVLIVEDEPDARELLRHVLEKAGAVVTDAANAREALALAETEPFDAMISDIGLPETDGLTMMRELRTRTGERGGRVPAIALTAYTRAHDRTAALQAGFQFHVGKPVDANELVVVLASLVGRLPPTG